MKKLNNAQGSILTMREQLQRSSVEVAQQLQRSSVEVAQQLQRSVSRAASVDHLPCAEYGVEVAYQHVLTEELLFLQHCRSALERAVDKGGSRLVWRWQDGGSTEVHFRRQNHHISMAVRQKSAA